MPPWSLVGSHGRTKSPRPSLRSCYLAAVAASLCLVWLRPTRLFASRAATAPSQPSRDDGPGTRSDADCVADTATAMKDMVREPWCARTVCAEAGEKKSLLDIAIDRALEMHMGSDNCPHALRNSSCCVARFAGNVARRSDSWSLETAAAVFNFEFFERGSHGPRRGVCLPSIARAVLNVTKFSKPSGLRFAAGEITRFSCPTTCLENLTDASDEHTLVFWMAAEAIAPTWLTADLLAGITETLVYARLAVDRCDEDDDGECLAYGGHVRSWLRLAEMLPREPMATVSGRERGVHPPSAEIDRIAALTQALFLSLPSQAGGDDPAHTYYAAGEFAVDVFSDLAQRLPCIDPVTLAVRMRATQQRHDGEATREPAPHPRPAEGRIPGPAAVYCGALVPLSRGLFDLLPYLCPDDEFLDCLVPAASAELTTALHLGNRTWAEAAARRMLSVDGEAVQSAAGSALVAAALVLTKEANAGVALTVPRQQEASRDNAPAFRVRGTLPSVVAALRHRSAVLVKQHGSDGCPFRPDALSTPGNSPVHSSVGFRGTEEEEPPAQFDSPCELWQNFSRAVGGHGPFVRFSF